MIQQKQIIQTVLKHYPEVQAIYFFGTYWTDDQWTDSDVDIALLLKHQQAKKVGTLVMSDLRFELERLLEKYVDLINCVAFRRFYKRRLSPPTAESIGPTNMPRMNSRC